LPTLPLSESSDEKMPESSAYGTSLRSRGMSNERRSLREADTQKASGRPHGLVVRRNLRVIGQVDHWTGSGLSADKRVIAGRPVRDRLKRIFDVLGAVFLGALFLPLIIPIVVLLRIDGGSVIFRHRRIGRDGKAFDCLKFRSMVPEADKALRDLLERHPELKAEWLHCHKLKNDPRITAVGTFLRRTSLDELPQLWNVVRGDMSLVGPRPVVREELLRYGRCAAIYLSSRPGVTGLWQVNGRNDINYRKRVVLDVYYIRRQSLLLDLYILAKTARVVVGGSGAY
jgi:exopolysaccharide production protein ExoY